MDTSSGPVVALHGGRAVHASSSFLVPLWIIAVVVFVVSIVILVAASK